MAREQVPLKTRDSNDHNNVRSSRATISLCSRGLIWDARKNSRAFWKLPRRDVYNAPWCVWTRVFGHAPFSDTPFFPRDFPIAPVVIESGVFETCGIMQRTQPIKARVSVSFHSLCTAIMANIVYTDFDPALVNIEGVSKNNQGGKQIRLSYGSDHGMIRMRGPPVPLEWGFSRYEGADPPQLSIEVRFQGHDDDSCKVKVFCDKLKALDDKILAYAKQHAVEILGKGSDEQKIAYAFKPLVKQKTENGTPVMRLKIAEINKNHDLPPAFDMTAPQTPQFPIENIAKEALVIPVFGISSVYIMPGQFGPTARVVQIGQLRPGIRNDRPQMDLDDDERMLLAPPTDSQNGSAAMESEAVTEEQFADI